MKPRQFLDGRITVHGGDCLDVLATLPEHSIDSVVTDPPYHLVSMVKRFANAKAENEDYALNKSHSGYMSRGFMGKQWDGGSVAFQPETWAAVLRVLKPGGHLIAFGGTRTYHRMACAIEDAGFEIRDQLGWVYGSGFPKSHDVSKGIDRAAGVTGINGAGASGKGTKTISSYDDGLNVNFAPRPTYISATDVARQWKGFGTALKPAWEPIVLARKPLVGTVAENVLAHGCGALNIDGCRIAAEDKTPAPVGQYGGSTIGPNGHSGIRSGSADRLGRWPANFIHDGSDEVLACFPETRPSSVGDRAGGCKFFMGGDKRDEALSGFGDSGSAARFFYCAKADAGDRLGSRHPTVKPLDLIQYLVRLVTPQKGVVLDPFAGTGTTGEASWREGFSAILIEREAEYLADIELRMKLCLAGPDERARESLKARQLEPVDAGPLFAVDAA